MQNPLSRTANGSQQSQSELNDAVFATQSAWYNGLQNPVGWPGQHAFAPPCFVHPANQKPSHAHPHAQPQPTPAYRRVQHVSGSRPFSRQRHTRTPPTQYWCFFDVEATGPSLRDNFVPCLGLAIVELCYDRLTGRLLQPRLVKRKKWYMKPPDAARTWNAQTVAKFWMKPAIRNFYEHVREILASDAPVAPSEAMAEFVALCRQYSGKGRNVSATLLSDTSGFDFAWLYYYLSHFGPRDTSPSTLFGYYKPVRDITSYFAGVSGSLNSRYPHHKTMQSGGIGEHEWREFARSVKCPPHNHDPENDAAHVALRSAWIVWRLDTLEAEARLQARESGDWRSRSRSPTLADSVQDTERRRLFDSTTPTLDKISSSSSGSGSGSSSGGSGSESDPGSTAGQFYSHLNITAATTTAESLTMALIVRTDLRMSSQQVSSNCAKASVSLLCGLSCDETTSEALLRCRRQKYRAADADTLEQTKRLAKQAKINYAMQLSERSGAPTVLAVGPVSAARLATIVGSLKPYQATQQDK